MPYLTFSPASGSVSWWTNPGTVGSIAPYRMAVKVGRTSRFRLVDRLTIPSSTPICAKKLDSSRDIGAQTWFSSSLPLTSRTIWNPHRCASSRARLGYLRLLKGIAISAVYPSSTICPPVSNSAFHERSANGMRPEPPPKLPPPPPRPKRPPPPLGPPLMMPSP